MSGAGAAVPGKEKPKPYREEDWLERHPSGVPQKLVDQKPHLKEKLDSFSFLLSKLTFPLNLKEWLPERQKECKATAEEQALYRKLLDQLFSPDYIYGKWIDFDQELMYSVMRKVEDILKDEPMLIDVPGDINVVGDLFGQMHDLWRVMAHATSIHAPGKKVYEHGRYLFLGNYVDRGHNSLEVVMTLFMLKILYPDRFFLLRGSHEFYNINIVHGFFEEMVARFGRETGKTFLASINHTFGFLSISAVIGESIYCCHGGVSDQVFNRSEINSISKPIHRSTQDAMLHDIIYSDPMEGLEGSMFNSDRGTSIYYGEDCLIFALKKIGCVSMIRGHTVIAGGYQWIWDSRCLTVFSASGVGKGKNNSAYVYITKECFSRTYFFKFDPTYRDHIKKRVKASAMFRRKKAVKEGKEERDEIEKYVEEEKEEDHEQHETGQIVVYGATMNKAK